jgi:hypothetical protein
MNDLCIYYIMDNLADFNFKYCYYCKLFYIRSYKKIICCNCHRKSNYFNINTLFYYKPLLLNNNYLIGIIWRLYDFDDYYSFNNYHVFEQLMKQIFTLILRTSIYVSNNDLILYLTNAYLLQTKRKKTKKHYYKCFTLA